jgi:hypothetical protein
VSGRRRAAVAGPRGGRRRARGASAGATARAMRRRAMPRGLRPGACRRRARRARRLGRRHSRRRDGGRMMRRRRPAIARGHAGAEPGHGQRGRDGRGLRPRRLGVLGQGPHGAAVTGDEARAAVGAAKPALEEARQGQQRGDLGPHGAPRERRDVEAGGGGLTPARLAVGDVAGHAPLVADPHAPVTGARDDRLHAQAALAGDELVVLLGQPPAGAEERRLDRRPAHPHPLADLAVAESTQLAHDEDLVMSIGEPVESAAQVVELHAGVEGRVRRRIDAPEALGAVVGVEGDDLGAPRAPESVDARVLGDLVDPRLEGDLGLVGAHPPQRRHEDFLRDVLGAAVVTDHPLDVGGDPSLVALVERLERALVARAGRAHERVICCVGAHPRDPARRGCSG